MSFHRRWVWLAVVLLVGVAACAEPGTDTELAAESGALTGPVSSATATPDATATTTSTTSTTMTMVVPEGDIPAPAELAEEFGSWPPDVFEAAGVDSYRFRTASTVAFDRDKVHAEMLGEATREPRVLWSRATVSDEEGSLERLETGDGFWRRENGSDWVAGSPPDGIPMFPLAPNPYYRTASDVMVGTLSGDGAEFVGVDRIEGRDALHYRVTDVSPAGDIVSSDVWVERSGLVLWAEVRASRDDGAGPEEYLLWTWETYDLGAELAIPAPPG